MATRFQPGGARTHSRPNTEQEFPATFVAREKSTGRSQTPERETFARPTGCKEGHVLDLGGVFSRRRPQVRAFRLQGADLGLLGIHGTGLTEGGLTVARLAQRFKPRALLARTIPGVRRGRLRSMCDACAYIQPKVLQYPGLLAITAHVATTVSQQSLLGDSWFASTRSPRAV